MLLIFLVFCIMFCVPSCRAFCPMLTVSLGCSLPIASSLFSEMHFESGAEVYLPFNQNRIIEYLCRASFRHQLRNVANIQMASKPDIFD